MTTKVIGIAVGALLALTGAAAAGGSAWIFSTLGSDGTVKSSAQTFSTSGAALVTSAADVRGINEVTDVTGDPRVRISLRPTAPTSGVFVGVGPAHDVERYLASAPVDEVTDIDVDPFKVTQHARPGSDRLAPPGDQHFWVAQSSGHDQATLRWKVRSGEYRLVVMNPDGSRGVSTQGDVALTIPHTSAIAWSVLGLGVLLLLGGAGTIVLAVRSSRASV